MLVLEELKDRIIENIDPDLLVEILDISTEELCNAFELKIEERRELFVDLEQDDDSFETTQSY